MRIGIIGGGVVGHATARCFMEWGEVRVYDVEKNKRTHTRDEVYECDIIFICTPEKVVEEVIRGILPEERSRNLVIKSTVPVGTTRRLSEQYELPNLVHSPEFLTERCAVTDAQLPARNIVGYVDGRKHTWGEGECVHDLLQLYQKRFPSVPCMLMLSEESELVKLAVNSFFATKIAFFNEIYSLVVKLGLNWDLVLEGILSDGRISHSHTKVPGPDGKRGFGGKCLPKDLEQLIECFRQNNLHPMVMSGAATRNLRFDRGE